GAGLPARAGRRGASGRRGAPPGEAGLPRGPLLMKRRGGGGMKRRDSIAIPIWGGISGPAPAQALSALRQNQSVAAAIQARLHRNAELANNRIAVTVERGVATLTGKVDSEQEKSDAARTALGAGIVGVDNRLEVGGADARQAAADGAVTAEIKGK